MPKSKPPRKKRSPQRPAPRRAPARPPSGLPPLTSLVTAMLRAGRDLIDVTDPLDAGSWASQVLGMWFKVPIDPLGRIEFEKRIRIEAVEAAEAARTPVALSILRALASLEPDEIAQPAREAGDRLAAAGIDEPVWASEVGRVEPVEVWTLTDPWGDQCAYHFTFRHPGREPHMVNALVDRNAGGIVMDGFFGRWPADIRARASEDPGAIVSDADLHTAAAEVLEAIAVGDQYLDNDWTDEFRQSRALLRARMHAIGSSAPVAAEPLSAEERDAIVAAFIASAGLPDAERAEAISGWCVNYACDYTPDGDPYRWSPIALEVFLLDWLPRKVMLDVGDIRAVPEVMRAWVAFALGRRGLEPARIAEAVAAVDLFVKAFRSAATDRSNFGPAKAMVNAMLGDGIDMTDRAAVDAWIDAFNARPFEERDEFLGPALGDAE